MDRQQSPDNLIRQKRLKRRKIILTIWDWIQSFFNWIKCTITFKKSIIVYCLGYVTYYAESTRGYYISIGLPVPDSVHNTVVTVFLGQLALTAISSLGSRAVEWVETKYEAMDNNDDINYG